MENQILFQISNEEKEKLKQIAKLKGLSLASFCRSTIFEKVKQEAIKE